MDQVGGETKELSRSQSETVCQPRFCASKYSPNLVGALAQVAVQEFDLEFEEVLRNGFLRRHMGYPG